ncbi:TIGR01777 family oxidoreductase [Lentzea sp. BCCO 10_0856]|uniref:TIGR01777 family oxidoreductase n=1 Tax=Lentzea miocenica TaxID=3095431 RepID=A0ABU4T167_9PSEU|nr:TIGR01777 family oxidoreductase [Lentzea sp. BCCO 10_0856]MDX8031888.1 TIGR01777 family oxidoreductase [Lentzea sp. BCCO 10_0856]
MKIVIPGGTGQVGTVLHRTLTAAGHEVVIISRSTGVRWDGSTLGDWASEIDGADVVINLAGRSVSCRYTAENLQQMMRSRVDSARVVGQAISKAAKPPSVWLQMSTATIYAHRFDAPNDEETGIIGGREKDVPGYWAYSVEIAKRWEAELNEADTPQTRKVALRAAMVMSPDKGGVFDYLSWLTRLGLGGPIAGGRQYVSWIHDDDFVRAIALLIREPIEGAVNLAAPNPVPQKDFMRELRKAWRIPAGLPATSWMAEIGAFAIRSDTELLLKSRRVVPGRLREAGFEFHFPNWREAAQNLAERRR